MNKIWSAKITLPVPMLLALALVLVGLLAFNNTPSVRADSPNPTATDSPNLASLPPINKTMNAKYVDSLMASKVPVANRILALNTSKQFPLSVIPQGPGSGLNADTLDSLDSSAFALAGHNHFGQAWTGSAGRGLMVDNTANAAGAVGIEGQTDSSGDSSLGVYGMANSNSGKVYGVVGQTMSSQGAGVYAVGSGPANPALEVYHGGITVAGAGINTTTAAFIQQATGGVGGNLLGNNTKITNPLSDGNPNAILIVTPNNDPEGVNAALTDIGAGVFYISGHWWIYHIDGSPISPGEAFNVLIINP